MNAKEKEIFEWLIEWVTDDETASVIINGGETGYHYGKGGYEEVNETLYETDDDYKEYVDNQKENWTIDAGLPGSGWYLIGSEY